MKTEYLDTAIPQELVTLARRVAIERCYDDLENGLQPLERLQEKYLAKVEALRECLALDKERVWFYREAAHLLYYASCSDEQSPSSEFASDCYVGALALLASLPYIISQKQAETAALALYRLRASRSYRKQKETQERRAQRHAVENAAIQAAIKSMAHWPGNPLSEVAEDYGGIPIPTLQYAHDHKLIPSRKVGSGKRSAIIIDTRDYLWYTWHWHWLMMQERKHGKEC